MRSPEGLAADGGCRPLAFVLTAGQAGDAPAFADVMAGLRRGGRPTAFDAGRTGSATVYLAGLHVAGVFLWSAR